MEVISSNFSFYFYCVDMSKKKRMILYKLVDIFVLYLVNVTFFFLHFKILIFPPKFWIDLKEGNLSIKST